MNSRAHDWAAAFALHAQATEAAIEKTCAAVRSVRTILMRAGTAPDRQGAGMDGASLPETVDEVARICAEWTSTGASDALSQRAKQTVELAARWKALSQTGADTAQQASSAKKLIPLAQRSSKYIATLSEVLQLRDNFEQRIDHITRGTPLVSKSEEWSPLLAVINAQAAGIATMTADYVSASEPACAALDKLVSDDMASGSNQCDESKELLPKLVDAVHGTIAVARAQILEIDSLPITSETHQDQPDASIERLPPLRESLFMLAEALQEHCVMLRRFDSDMAEKTVSVLTEPLQDFRTAHALLSKVATNLSAYASDIAKEHQGAIVKTDEDATSLQALSELYTMEAERDIHIATVHSLR
ncbi:MAG: hypothetical protein ACFB03_22000 [Paracoccaceae bacterium]